MASNKELREQIAALQVKHGIADLGADIEKLNNVQLVELVATLEAGPPPAANAAPDGAGADGAAGDGAGAGDDTETVRPIDGTTGDLARRSPPRSAQAQQPSEYEYSVGPRASLMANGGRILTTGMEVIPERDAPNPEDLDRLIASKVIVKRPS